MTEAGTSVLLNAILGLFGIMGVGDMYAGRVGRGIALLIIGLVLVVAAFFTFGITAIFYLIIWIISIVQVNNYMRNR